MSQAATIAEKLKAAFPGLRVTSTYRSQEEQDNLRAAGRTRARRSQHTSGTGLDVVLPKGVTSKEVRLYLSSIGEEPGEFLNESGKGSNQGTGAHLHIGLAPKAKGGDRASAGGGSTYDRVARNRAERAGNAEPDMRKVWQARARVGKPGGMSAQEAAVFDQQNFVPPPGFENVVKHQSGYTLPVELIHAYNSHQMDDDPAARAEVERLVKSGEAVLPKGLKLEAPAPRTMGQRFGMGVRNVLEGAGGLIDIAAAPVNAGINAVAGTELSTTPFRDVGAAVADKAGLAKPESASENLASAIVEGGTQGLIGAGGGIALSGAKGATGTVAKALASNPVLDTVSGATSGHSSETARQAGAGPVGQFVAGLAGGATPVGLAATAERTASRIRAPKTIPDIVAETPRAAVIDETGALTPEGQEIATRHGITPDEVRRAYEPSPEEATWASNDSAVTPSVAREATNDLPLEQVGETPPIRKIEEAPVEQAAIVDEVAATPAPQAPTPAAARVAAGQEFGVDYSRGQATKSFDVQDAEQRLANSAGPEAEQMRQFKARQQEQVSAAVSDFRSAFEDTAATPEERGIMVQEAMRELENLGQKGVSALYKLAREMGEPVDLDTTGIKSAYDRVMVEANVPDSAKAEITQEAARYGLIGKPEQISSGAVTSENGITRVKLDNGQTVSFYGEPQQLRLDNAEEFRKVISDLYPSDGSRKLTQLLKRAVDDAVEEAAVKVADGTGGNMSDAMKAAREAHVTQKKTFGSKDVIQQVVDWKKGAEGVTSMLKPEQVMQRALATTSDLKRIKAVLLSKPTVQSKAAWRAIQAHGLATIFEKATTRSTNVAGEITEAVSGAKLRSAIEAFGPDKLKVLLDPDDFNRLMKLRRVIEDVTIPITGTVNHSNSGNLLMRLMSDVDNKVTGAFASAGLAIGGPAGGAIGGAVGRTIGPVIKQAKEAREAAATLKGATEYTAEQAATETAKEGMAARRQSIASKAKDGAATTVKAFIETYSDPRIIAPVIASTAGSREE